ncbi:MAG: zinc-binding alcohol dehydrogenase [Bacteroidota bacterium]
MKSKHVSLWHSKSTSWLEESTFDHNKSNDMVTVESLYSLVSQGTERLAISQPLSSEVANRLAVPYMKGSLDSTFTYGYSLVGRVLDGPEHLLNNNVHLLHPHQSHARVLESDLFALDANFDPRRAVFASNMETAVNAIWDAQLELGDRLLIIGYGTIGALIGQVAERIVGVPIDILEIAPERRSKIDTHRLIEKVSPGAYDVAFNATGNGQMLQVALSAVRNEGRVVELSWYGESQVSLQLGTDFHYGRKQIIGSQVSNIPFRKQPNWDYKKRKMLVMDLLESFDATKLIDQEIPWSHAAYFFNELRAAPFAGLGVIINYNE